MKNIIIFYILILLPLLGIGLLAKFKYLSPIEFAWAMGIYCLVYHPLISILRLVKYNKVTRSEIWLCFIPCYDWKYFSFLFFNTN